jgi:hypothetical protein
MTTLNIHKHVHDYRPHSTVRSGAKLIHMSGNRTFMWDSWENFGKEDIFKA